MIRALLIGASFLALAACSSATAPIVAPSTPVVAPAAPVPIPTAPAQMYPNALPTNERWKLAPGSWVEYARYTATGSCDPKSGLLTVTSPEVADGYTMRVTDLATTLPTDPTQVCIAHLVTAVGVELTDPNFNDNSRIMLRQSDVAIGECSNVYSLSVDPPEYYLSNTPVIGEHVIETSALANGGTLVTERWTTACTNTTAETTLIENPGTATARGYWFSFSGGILVSVALGNIALDGSVSLQVLRSTNTGQNA